MPKQSSPALWLITIITVLSNACNEQPSTTSTSITRSDDSDSIQYGGYASQVKWGEHLVNEHGCKGCHTPKKILPQGTVMDSSLLFSGHPTKMPPPDIDRRLVETKHLSVSSEEANAWIGKWGISYAANLTPDATGIGSWKEEQFIYAIREGKYKGLAGARSLLPPMPWRSYRYMNDHELKAMFAYLKSIKPIKNVVPQAQPPVIAVKESN